MDNKYEEQYCYKEGSFNAAKNKCANFVHACIITDATITYTSSLSNGFPVNQCRYREFIFKIKIRKDLVNEFEQIAGLNLEEPPKVSLNL